MTMPPLLLLDAFARRNRAVRQGRLGEWPLAAAAVFGVACAALAVAHVLRWGLQFGHAAAVALLAVVAGYAGLRCARAAVAQAARPVFRDWLQVLPIPQASVLHHWRRNSARRASVFALAGAVTCVAAAWLGDLGPHAGAGSALVLACAAALGLVHGLRKPPALQHATATPSGRARLLRSMDSRRLPYVGVWQLRRSWTRHSVAWTLLASLLIFGFATGVGVAQATTLPVVFSGLLVAIAIFNKSLDPGVLLSTPMRLLPLSRWQRTLALARLPAWLSAVAMGAGLLLAVLLPIEDQLGRFRGHALLAIAGWAVLVGTRLIACLRHPGGGLRVDLDHLALLVLSGALLQTAGPAGFVLALFVLAALLRRTVRALP